MKTPRGALRAFSGLTIAGVAGLALAACGTTPAPGQGSGTASGVGSGSTQVAPTVDLAPDGALACPDTIPTGDGTFVPAKPQGVPGAERLLPDTEPKSLVVCTYPVADMKTQLRAPFAMSQRKVLDGPQRDSVVGVLAWAPKGTGAPKPCTMMAGPEAVQLVGVTYPTGVVWVSAKADPNQCADATNGEFISSQNLGAKVTELAARYVQNPPPMLVCDGPGGRWGDHKSLAPEGDPGVIVCRRNAKGGWETKKLTDDQAKEVVTSLRALNTQPATRAAECKDPARPSYTLALSYPNGPAALVRVSADCTPGLSGWSLASADAAAIGDLNTQIEKWSPPIPGPDPNGSVSSDLQDLSGTRPDAVGGGAPQLPSDVPPAAPQVQPTPAN